MKDLFIINALIYSLRIFTSNLRYLLTLVRLMIVIIAVSKSHYHVASKNNNILNLSFTFTALE